MKPTLFLAALLLAFSPLAQAKPNHGNAETDVQTDKKAEKDAKKPEHPAHPAKPTPPEKHQGQKKDGRPLNFDELESLECFKNCVSEYGAEQETCREGCASKEHAFEPTERECRKDCFDTYGDEARCDQICSEPKPEPAPLPRPPEPANKEENGGIPVAPEGMTMEELAAVNQLDSETCFDVCLTELLLTPEKCRSGCAMRQIYLESADKNCLNKCRQIYGDENRCQALCN